MYFSWKSSSLLFIVWTRTHRLPAISLNNSFFLAFVEFLKPGVVLAAEAPPLLILVKRVPYVQLCSFLQHQSTHFKLQTNYSLQSTDYRQTNKELSKNYPRKLTLRNQSKCIIHRNDSFFCWLTYKQYFKSKTTLCYLFIA